MILMLQIGKLLMCYPITHMSNNYPAGAANDINAPYNEPLRTEVTAEVGVELGLFLKIEVYNEEEIEDEIKNQIYERFKSKNVEINSINVYQYDFPN